MSLLQAVFLLLAAFTGSNMAEPPPPQPAQKARDLGTPSQAAVATVAPGEIGSRLPEFAVKGLRGHALSSADLRGKVVLIDFWGTWCQPCKKEMPGYQRLVDRYGPKGFVVIGFKVDVMPDTEPPLRFAHKLGVRYPLALATSDLMARFGGLEGLPTTLLYDRTGILQKKIIGFEYTNVIEAEVKRLL